MENLFILLNFVGVFACGFYLLMFRPSRAVLASIAVFMLVLTFGPFVYLYVETRHIRGAVVEGSLLFVILVGVGVAVSQKKLVELVEVKARKCPSCGKPRLVWPDCYTCVNPDCERFVAGLVEPEPLAMTEPKTRE